MRSIGSYVADTVKSFIPCRTNTRLYSAAQSGNPGEAVGKCPRCGGNILENNKAFSCDKYSSALFKDSKFWSAKKKKLTKDIAAALLTKGRVFLSGLHSEKTGKLYSATIILDDKGEGYPGFRMEFDK